MRLTNRTDYALRVLMYLVLNGEGLTTIGEIAEHYRISRHHLVRVVWELARAGFVETVRGRGGGMRLARAAETISVGGWRGAPKGRSRLPNTPPAVPTDSRPPRAATTGRLSHRRGRRFSSCSTATPSAIWSRARGDFVQASRQAHCDDVRASARASVRCA